MNENLKKLDELLTERAKREVELIVLDKEIDTIWNTVLAELSDKEDDLRTNIERIERYVEENRPGLMSKIKENAIKNTSKIERFESILNGKL